MVAIGMFTLIMLAVMQIFATSFASYRDTKKVQRNLQATQFAINTMAKELRTSSVLTASGASSTLNILFIDYSQNGGRGTCIRYWVLNGELRKASLDMSASDPNQNRSDCATAAVVFRGVLARGISASSQNIIQSEDDSPGPRVVGRVTVGLKVGSEAYNEVFQTSVSLRDFNYIGI